MSLTNVLCGIWAIMGLLCDFLFCTEPFENRMLFSSYYKKVIDLRVTKTMW